MIERFSYFGKKSAGFAFFLAWVYCSFFSCALVPVVYELRCSERFWCIAAVSAGVTALVFNLAFRRRKAPNAKLPLVVGTLCATAGTLVIWFGFFDADHFATAYSAGGTLAGIGLAAQFLFWGDTLSSQDEESVELVIPCGFVIACICYLVLLPLKSLTTVLIIAAFPLVSLYLGIKQRNAAMQNPAAKTSDDKSACNGKSTHDGKSPAKISCIENGRGGISGLSNAESPAKTSCIEGGRNGIDEPTGREPSAKIPYIADRLIVLFVLQAALWFNFAFFRTFSSPNYLSDRFVHYLIPFSISCTISILILLASLRTARSISFSLAHRIALPLMCLSYAVLALAPDDIIVRRAAYTVNFISMFTMQLGMWLAMTHYVHARNVSARKVFGWFLTAEGLGIAAGVTVGLQVVGGFDASFPVALALFFLTVPVAVAMAYGYNDRAPRRITYQEPSESSADTLPAPDEGHLIAAATLRQAKTLGERYYLSKRECEVLALLLEGRNRPFIRDELFISLNTVNAHVRSIYAKCDVHSQQELLSLAREKRE